MQYAHAIGISQSLVRSRGIDICGVEKCSNVVALEHVGHTLGQVKWELQERKVSAPGQHVILFEACFEDDCLKPFRTPSS